MSESYKRPHTLVLQHVAPRKYWYLQARFSYIYLVFLRAITHQVYWKSRWRITDLVPMALFGLKGIVFAKPGSVRVCDGVNSLQATLFPFNLMRHICISEPQYHIIIYSLQYSPDKNTRPDLLYAIARFVTSNVNRCSPTKSCRLDTMDIYTEPILGLCPANERRRYNVTTSLVGRAQT